VSQDSLTVLAILGRLCRAKENVKIAQREINEALQAIFERANPRYSLDEAQEELAKAMGPGDAALPPLPHVAIYKALERLQAAAHDVECLAESMKAR